LQEGAPLAVSNVAANKQDNDKDNENNTRNTDIFGVGPAHL